MEEVLNMNRESKRERFDQKCPNQSRRQFLLSAATGLAITPWVPSCVGQLLAQEDRRESDRRPEPAKFESGDFIWPKRPGAFVPYHSKPAGAYDDDRAQWEREKQAFINRVTSDPAAPNGLVRLARRLERMEFREFLALYLADEKPGVPDTYGGRSPIYVGHVGILFLKDNGEPWVVEAVWEGGVRTISYQSWLGERPDDIVWHGRLKDQNRGDRAKIAEEALRYKGKPYDFWNFDLADSSGFYCSKLAWLAVFQALKIATDDDRNSQRWFWYSPKQLMNSSYIYKLHDPGSYTWR